jgi:hypothetical protein
MDTKNKVNDNYFSDDEQINNDFDDGEEIDEHSDEDGEDTEEYEIDDETRRIIFEHAKHSFEEEKTINNNNNKNNKKTIKQPKQNKKQVLSLNEFNKKVEQDIIARKPKKFMSKRVGDKKIQLGMQNEPIIKRSFNPRNQPFNFVKSNDINVKLDILNLEDFPSL